MSKLISPHIKYKKSYLSALSEFHKEGLNLQFDYNKVKRDFKGLIKFYENFSKGIGLSPGVVTTTQFWLIDKEEYIGRVDIRPKLNVFYEHGGGHISYQIRPSKRKMGYGKKILGLALKEIKKMGLENALLTVGKNNIGSQKIITHWGGVYRDSVKRPDTTVPEFRYDIDVRKALKMRKI